MRGERQGRIGETDVQERKGKGEKRYEKGEKGRERNMLRQDSIKDKFRIAIKEKIGRRGKKG